MNLRATFYEQPAYLPTYLRHLSASLIPSILSSKPLPFEPLPPVGRDPARTPGPPSSGLLFPSLYPVRTLGTPYPIVRKRRQADDPRPSKLSPEADRPPSKNLEESRREDKGEQRKDARTAEMAESQTPALPDLSDLDDDYGDFGTPAGKASSSAKATPPFVLPLPPNKFKTSKNKRQLSNSPTDATHTVKHSRNTHPHQSPGTTTAAKKYTKIFIDLTNCRNKNMNYSNINKLLSTNKYSKYINHLQRAKDNTGYIITFTSQEHANTFKNTMFNNDLDNANIRDTNKPKRNIHADILIHNVDTDITTEEIEEDLSNTYNIPIHSVYRLTRQSQHPPHNRYNTFTVKVTIDSSDTHIFENNIKLFQYNVHKTSKPTPPPTVTQCYNCFEFGHTKYQCTQSEQTCIRCGNQHTGDCPQQLPTCKHCQQQHVPTYKNCPTYKKIIQDKKQKQRQTYAETLKQKTQRATTQRQTYLLPTPTQNYQQPTPTLTQHIPQYFKSPPKEQRPQRPPRHLRQNQHYAPQHTTYIRSPPRPLTHRAHQQDSTSAAQDLQNIFANTTPDQILPLLKQLIFIITELMQNFSHQEQQYSYNYKCI